MQINPAVHAAAELFTDGRITDHLLADVAAMHRLPLYIEVAPIPQPDATDAALRALANAEARHRDGIRCYVAARAAIGPANRLGATKEVNRGHRAYAFRMLNKRRAELLRDERGLAAARAALAALTPVTFAQAA